MKIKKKYKGRWVIARTRNAGVIFGKVVSIGNCYVELKNARRVWKPISRDKKLSWYEGVADSGLCPEKGVISGTVGRKLLVEDYELTVCSKEGARSLKNAKTNETTY